MRPPRGFTLVELLVVIAVIGILVALLFPAVQAAREAGRRITCANHMKQFALATANYSAVNGDSLPPALLGFFSASGRRQLRKGEFKCETMSVGQSPGWRVAVLPFLEEQSLYDQFNFSKGVVTEPNYPAISQVLPVFQCPSMPGYPRSTLQRKPDTVKSHGFSVGVSDYGVPAHEWEQANDTNGNIMSFVPAWNGTKNPSMYGHRNFACELEPKFGRPARLVWVRDGLSKTTLAHEHGFLPNIYDRNGLDGQSFLGEQMSGKMWPVAHGQGWAQGDLFMPRVRTPINSRNQGRVRFSFHPGGVNNTLIDGSVRFIDDSVEEVVLREMDSRAGREDLYSYSD